MQHRSGEQRAEKEASQRIIGVVNRTWIVDFKQSVRQAADQEIARNQCVRACGACAIP